MRLRKNKQGFTLIELLVVIAIIGLLAAIVLTAVSGARKKARTAQRVTGLRQIATALDQYYYANNAKYPSTAGAWQSECAAWGSYASNLVIPGLVPTYISQFPADPTMDKPNNRACFVYRSDPPYDDYVLLDYDIAEFTSADYKSIPSFVDAGRDGGADPCVVDGSAIYSWKLYSPGGKCW